MVQARIEITPAEQLQELRKARDRYAALADRLHNSDDTDMDADARQAREQDIRRILQSYEKSIADSVVRMSSMDGTRRNVRPTLGIRTWLSILVALAALEGGILLMYFHPEFFTLSFLQRVRIEIVRGSSAPVAVRTGPVFAPAAPQSAAPPQIASATPPAITPQTPRPAATPKPAAPKPAARPLVTRSAQQEPARSAATPKPVAPKPVTQSSPPAAAAPTPVPQPTPQIQVQAPAQAPLQTLAQPPVQTPAPSPVQAPPPVVAANPPQAASQQQPPTRLEPIAATHTPPPYPATAKRLGETGTTRMRVTVSSLGAPTECRVVQSSGSVRLDTAACSHVQANWRWKPATRDGQPVATGLDLTVVWKLRQAP